MENSCWAAAYYPKSNFRAQNGREARCEGKIFAGGFVFPETGAGVLFQIMKGLVVVGPEQVFSQ